MEGLERMLSLPSFCRALSCSSRMFSADRPEGQIQKRRGPRGRLAEKSKLGVIEDSWFPIDGL